MAAPKTEVHRSAVQDASPDIDVLASLPMRIRVSLWMLFGAAIGLPVDGLVEMINLQLTTSKRTLRGKRLRMTVAEHLVSARIAERLGGAFRHLFTWIVSPDACIRWLKRYQERRANASKNRPKAGRPWISQEKVDAILKIYDSGLTGLKRIVDEMKKCHLPVAKSTVRRVLTRHGRPPADSNRRRGSTWGQFWRRHAPHLVGIDFLQIPVGLLTSVRNCFVFFAIEHDTRRIHILGFDFHAGDCWVANAIRSATMDGDDLASRKKWIHDNDSRYGPQFRRILTDRGLKSVRTSVRSPDMNSIAERWVKSLKEECLGHVVMLNEAMLREYVHSYVTHYNAERPHQGIGNRPIGPWHTREDGDIVCDDRLDGLLTSFRRAA